MTIATHPGEIIRDEIEARGTSAYDLAVAEARYGETIARTVRPAA